MRARTPLVASKAYIVKRRSFTRPTRVFNRGGWRDVVAWTKWKTVSRHDTYEAAAEARDALDGVALSMAAVFYEGKPYHRAHTPGGYFEFRGYAATQHPGVRKGGEGRWVARSEQ